MYNLIFYYFNEELYIVVEIFVFVSDFGDFILTV